MFAWLVVSFTLKHLVLRNLQHSKTENCVREKDVIADF